MDANTYQPLLVVKFLEQGTQRLSWYGGLHRMYSISVLVTWYLSKTQSHIGIVIIQSKMFAVALVQHLPRLSSVRDHASLQTACVIVHCTLNDRRTQNVKPPFQPEHQ